MSKRLSRDERQQLRELGWRYLFLRNAKRPEEIPDECLLEVDGEDDDTPPIEVVDLEDQR